MKRSDLMIVLTVAVAGILVGFWLLVLGPKRDDASTLGEQVDQLRASVAEQQQLVAEAKQAQKDFDTNYRRLVVLGKSVPADSDTPSLLVEVQRLADRANVDFRSIELSDTGAGTDAAQVAAPAPLVAPGESTGDTSGAAPAATDSSASTGTAPAATDSSASTGTAPTATDSSSTAPSTGETATTATPTATTAAPATEASAALLPLGATVGPAGLSAMPYELKFTGGFFEIADFMHRLDSLVHVRGTEPVVSGRLLTVNGFTLAVPIDIGGGSATPALDATLSVTTYVAPADQGATAGATPSGPSTSLAATPTTPTTSTTASATTPTP